MKGLEGIKKGFKKDEKKKILKIKRADRFKRIKNKNEKVYAAPEFFRKSTGILSIAESGIFKQKYTFSKAYELAECQEELQLTEELIHKLCRSNSYMQCIVHKSKQDADIKTYLVLGQNAEGMEQAQEQFFYIEDEIKEGWKDCDILEDKLKKNHRFDVYQRFLAGAFGKEQRIENYLEEIYVWKELSELKGAEMLNECCIKTEGGIYSIAVVEKFPYVIEGNCLKEIIEQSSVAAAAVEVESVSDAVVAQFYKSCYIGTENVLSRMKRKNPMLHQVIAGESLVEGEEQVGVEGHIFNASVSFLLKAETLEEMEESREYLFQIGKKHHMRLRSLHFTRPDVLQAFGLTGERMDYSGRFLLKRDIHKIMPYTGKACESADRYDVEELKKLFMN